MTVKRFTLAYADYDWWAICDKENPTELGISGEDVVDVLNELHEEKEYFKTKFHEERELAMRLSRECDTLTITKQELELEIIRLETIIRTGDDDDCNSTS